MGPIVLTDETFNTPILTQMSIPFNFYVPAGLRKLEIWIPSVPRAHARELAMREKAAEQTQEASSPAKSRKANDDMEEDAAEMLRHQVLRARRKQVLSEGGQDLEGQGEAFKAAIIRVSLLSVCVCTSTDHWKYQGVVRS